MSWAEIAAIFSCVVSVFTLIRVFYFAATQFAALQVKVDTMWEFTLRRGKSEAVAGGFATLNSPLVVAAVARQHLDPLMPDMRAIFHSFIKPVTDADLALAIEAKLGDRLLHEVCIPARMLMGACVVLAVQLLRDEAATKVLAVAAVTAADLLATAVDTASKLAAGQAVPPLGPSDNPIGSTGPTGPTGKSV